MDDYVFIQRGRLGRTVFRLNGTQLEIDRWLFGRRSQTSVPLSTFNGDYEIRAVRLHWLYLWPAFVATLAAGLVYFVLPKIPENLPVHGLLIYPGIIFAAGFAGFVKGLRRVEFFLFFDQWKRPVVQVLREPGETSECDAFVSELLYRIEQTAAGLPIVAGATGARPPLGAARLIPPPEAEHASTGGRRWLFALISGSLAAAPLCIPPLTATAGEGLMLGLYILVVSAFAFAGLSYAHHERQRHRALIGVILAALALYLISTAYRSIAVT